MLGVSLQTTQRQFSDYLDRTKQSLAEPLAAIQGEAAALKQLPAISQDTGMLADVERITQAAAEMTASL